MQGGGPALLVYCSAGGSKHLVGGPAKPLVRRQPARSLYGPPGEGKGERQKGGVGVESKVERPLITGDAVIGVKSATPHVTPGLVTCRLRRLWWLLRHSLPVSQRGLVTVCVFPSPTQGLFVGQPPLGLLLTVVNVEARRVQAATCCRRGKSYSVCNLSPSDC